MAGRPDATGGNGGEVLRDLVRKLKHQHEVDKHLAALEYVAEHGLNAELPLYLRSTEPETEETIAGLEGQEGWDTPEARELIAAWRSDAKLADLERRLGGDA